LQLVLTNAIGTNITSIMLINGYPGSIQTSNGLGGLTLSWPTNLGWTLQAQTTSVGGPQHQLGECGQFDHN